MALTATVYSFEINLSDLDRNVCQVLAFRVAKHPSETDAYLMTRVLAYCLEYCEGLRFSKGGLPEPARLHRASKASPQVAVYSHKDVDSLLARLAAQQIHRAAEIQINTFDRELIATLSARLTRRMIFDLVITERQIYLSLGAKTISGSLVRHN